MVGTRSDCLSVAGALVSVIFTYLSHGPRSKKRLQSPIAHGGTTSSRFPNLTCANDV